MKRFAAFWAVTLLAVVAAHGQAPSTKVITGATLIDGTGRPPIKDAIIVIEGTRIREVGTRNKTKIPKGAEIIDVRGSFIIPGLADMHHHIGGGSFSPNQPPQDYRNNLARLLAWGITTVFAWGFEPDMKTFSDLRSLSRKDSAPYPHLFGAGHAIAVEGGYGWKRAYTPETPEEARMQVRELKAANVDAVKFSHTDLHYETEQVVPLLKPEVIAAIIDEAHQLGLKVYVHAPLLKYAKEVLRAGADGLVHGIISDPIDDEFIELMKTNGAVYITTHMIYEVAADMAAWARRFDEFDDRGIIPKEVYETGVNPATPKQWEEKWENLPFLIPYLRKRLPILRANLKKVQEAGIQVVAGSDTSSGGIGVLLGVSSQMELMLLVEAGLTPMEVIRASTINAARMIGREGDLGSVEPGKLADMVILKANPLADISNVRRIYRVVKGGVLYDPAELLDSAR